MRKEKLGSFRGKSGRPEVRWMDSRRWEIMTKEQHRRKCCGNGQEKWLWCVWYNIKTRLNILYNMKVYNIWPRFCAMHGGVVVRTSDSYSKEPGFKYSCYRFKSWAVSFTRFLIFREWIHHWPRTQERPSLLLTSTRSSMMSLQRNTKLWSSNQWWTHFSLFHIIVYLLCVLELQGEAGIDLGPQFLFFHQWHDW